MLTQTIVFVFSLVLSLGIAPLVIMFLTKHAVHRRAEKKMTMYGTKAEEFEKLHGGEETVVPRMGGIIALAPALLTTGFLYSMNSGLLTYSAKVTLMACILLILGFVVGLACDAGDLAGRHISKSVRLFLSAIAGGTVGYFLLYESGITVVQFLPYTPVFDLGWLIIPLIVLWFMSWYATTVIDGIDGLSGSVTLIISLGLAFILSLTGNPLPALFFALAGGIAGFLWYNIKPARVYMSETGMMPILWLLAFGSLFVALTPDVFFAEEVSTVYNGAPIPLWFLLFSGVMLFITISSNILQLVWRKIYNKKLFKIAPFHHHLEALGMPAQSVVLRYTLITLCATTATVVAVLLSFS